MSATRKLDRHQAAEFLDGLRRDISAARLRVTLDHKLGRETPRSVKTLAALPEPPAIETETDPAGGQPDNYQHLLDALKRVSADRARLPQGVVSPGFILVTDPESLLEASGQHAPASLWRTQQL